MHTTVYGTLCAHTKHLNGKLHNPQFSIFRCSRGTCRELVCGLKLYEDSDEDLFAQLVASIKTVQESGALVKLSYGGIRYGNIHVPTRVSFFPLFLNLITKLVHWYFVPKIVLTYC